jgi:seryl-tRNA synthetase
MLDIKRIINDRDAVEQALAKRMPVEDMHLSEIIDLHNEWKVAQQLFESERARQKEVSDKLSKVDKGSDDFQVAIKEAKVLSAKVKDLENNAKKLSEKLVALLEVLPNIPEDIVPAGGKEANTVVKEWGEKPVFDFEIKDHVKIAKDLNMIDFERGVKIGGNNFVMYTGAGAQLEWALLNFFIDERLKDGFEMVIPPHLVTRESAYTAGQLPKFEDDVFWTKDNRCLIPTAETALANVYRDDILSEEDLPKKIFAYTPCYRKEAGTYRAGERGTIRMHQFNKVEMFVYCAQEDSAEILQALIKKSESLVEQLGLHYRTTLLGAGDCAVGSSITYDVEVWLPAIQKYYEVSSASNVKTYQSRRGNMRYRTEHGLEYLHTLNASGLATSRLFVALLETYQQADGSVKVPKVLQKYMNTEIITNEK